MFHIFSLLMNEKIKPAQLMMLNGLKDGAAVFCLKEVVIKNEQRE